jgi:hypothetical protein
MMGFFRHGAVMMVASLLLIGLARAEDRPEINPSPDEALRRRVLELETEVKELHAEMLALRNAGGAPSAPAAAVQSNLVPAATDASAAPSPTNSLGSLLGPAVISGFVDVYYGQNFNNPAARVNGFRFFDGTTNQFGLNLVELVADKAPDPNNSRTGYRIALGFGQAMNAVNGSDPGGLGFSQYLKEAYFSYLAPIAKGLQVDVGKFVTPHGAEVIETKDNWNYSRGLLFSYAIPYYHFGMRAKYAFNDKYALTGFFVNGWNSVVDNNTGKTYGVGFAWNPNKKFGVIQNYMAGPEQTGLNSHWRQLSDTVITYSPTSRLSFIVNGDYGRGDRIDLGEGALSNPVFWTGVAAYARYAVDSSSAFSARFEHYDDPDGFTTGTAQHLNGFTTTFEQLMAHHIISRVEFRRDMSNQPTFLKGVNPVTAQNTLTAGLVFTFDSREGK